MPATASAVPEAFKMLPLFACIGGIFLGLYFNVLVLLLVSLTGSAIFVLIGSMSGFSSHAGLGDFLFPLILVQVGYMLGLASREAYGHIMARFHATQSTRI
jgi:hypothetical protein